MTTDDALEVVSKIFELVEERNELISLFDLQHTRMAKAEKLWRESTGYSRTKPDLGELLDWLMDQREMYRNQLMGIGK